MKKKPFALALAELLVTTDIKDNAGRLLTYLGGADAALEGATVEELTRVQAELLRCNPRSAFLQVITAALSRRVS